MPEKVPEGIPARSRAVVGRGARRVPLRGLWLILLLLAVGWLVLAPMVVSVWGSFRDGPPGAETSFTLENYVSAYGSERLARALTNSVIFAVGASLLSFVVGAYLAWVTERTNMPFRGAIYALMLLPIVVPGVITTISWVLLLNPTIGLLNEAVQLIPGVEATPFDSYGMLPMIWAEGIDGISLPFLLMAAAFRSMDPSLEEASAVAGGGGFYTMRTITLPALAPAVLSILLLLFIKAIEGFEVPAVMGMPDKVVVFATEIFIASQEFPVNHGLAAAFAMGYVLLTAAALGLYYRAVRSSEKFATVTGKGFKPTRVDLGRKKWLWGLGTAVLLFIAVVLPFLVMIYASLLPFYRVPSMAAFESMTLDNYREFLTDSKNMKALSNNLKVGITSSLAVIVLSTVVAWVIVRTRIRGRAILDAISFAPIAIPGIVFALALTWLYLSVPTPVKIYGTLAMLGLGFVAKYLPYAMRASHAGLSQIGVELEEASATSGASWLRTFTSIISPLMAGSLLVAFVYVLTLTFKTLSLPVMLAGPSTELLAVRIYAQYVAGNFAALNAIGVIIFVILIVLAGISRLVASRFGYLETDK
jgi:iron(III) transport system permease protein